MCSKHPKILEEVNKIDLENIPKDSRKVVPYPSSSKQLSVTSFLVSDKVTITECREI